MAGPSSSRQNPHDTTKDLAELIQSTSGIPFYEPCLIVTGKDLPPDPGMIPANAGITDEATVHLALRTLGVPL